MKKFIKIFSLTLLVILVILITAPFLFKGKIIKVANEQLEKSLKAKASFEDINLSLIRNFPNLGIRLKNLCIVGIEEFESDTLIHVKSFDVVVDVVSAIKMENIKIKKILIDEPYVNAIVLKNGKANWDIAPESDTTAMEPVDTTTSAVKTKIALKLFKIQDARIRYNDQKSKMSASLDRFNFSLSGDLSQDFSVIIIDSKSDKVKVVMDGIPYLNNVSLHMHFAVDANLKESIYKLNKNEFSLNALTLMWDGSIEMPESGDIITNLSFATSNTDFKTLLSLVPAIYMNDFKDLKTTGNLKLEGKISGAVTEKTTPTVDATLLVSNATFSYPDLPKSAKDIQLDVKLHYDGVQNDNTTVDVNKFHIDLGGNPIDLVLNLKTPISDPFTNGKLVASLDLQTIRDIIPLDKTELKGVIKAELDWMGKLSSIENQKYEDFKADGSVDINNLYYNSPDVPKAFSLKTSHIIFSPKTVEISNFDATLGLSDFRLKGKITNYIPFVLKDETVKGELTLNSNLINVNEFMTESENPEQADQPEDTSAVSAIEVPGNIDFKFSSTIAKVLYDKLDISNLTGTIIIRDKQVLMENLSMNTLDGSLALSGNYNTQDIKNPAVVFKINAANIDIPKTSAAFDLLGKVAPMASKATGKVSMALNYSSLLKSDMSPVLNSISGDGHLSSKQIGIRGSKGFDAIGTALKTDALKNTTLKDVELDFEIEDGNLTVKPFDTKVGDITMNIGGQQTFENTLDYSINLSAPRKLLGLENPAINDLYNNAASKGINVDRSETVDVLVKLTGALTDPTVKLDLMNSPKSAVENVKENVKEEAKEVIDKKKEEVKEDAKKQAREQADKIMKEAERQAATVRSDAKKAADAVRAEANANANKVLNEAKNPVAKKAAEPAAKKIRNEGESKAKGIEREADQRANKILSDAKAKSDKLLQ
jgi:hypothetical protein